MAEIICEIFIGTGVLDDDYTFYDDGKIKRFFDQSTWKYNQEEWLTAEQISDHKKAKLIDKCPSEFKDKIKEILYPEK